MRDQHALAMKCQEIEKSGGDVLEWLKAQGHISARATWQRLQLNELGRNDTQITDGKGKRKMQMKVTAEQKRKAVFLAIEGGDAAQYLAKCGSKSGYTMWKKIRQDLKKGDPDLYLKLIAATDKRKRGKKETGTAKASKKTEEKKVTEATEETEETTPETDRTLPFQHLTEAGDQETEEITVKEEDWVTWPEYPRIPPRLKYQEPLNDMKVDKGPEKITRPINYDGFDMEAMRSSETGFRYEYRGDQEWFSVERGPDCMELRLDDWRKLIRELPKAARILGVELL